MSPALLNFTVVRAEDTRAYFKSMVDTFSRWFNTFLDLKICKSGIGVFGKNPISIRKIFTF